MQEDKIFFIIRIVVVCLVAATLICFLEAGSGSSVDESLSTVLRKQRESGKIVMKFKQKIGEAIKVERSEPLTQYVRRLLLLGVKYKNEIPSRCRLYI